MKKLIFILAMFSATGVYASENVLKSMKCEGATLAMSLDVVQENQVGAVAIVSWVVSDVSIGQSSAFMGYLFSEGSLKDFSSTDMGSDVEVSGSVAVVRLGDKEEALFCK